MRNFVGFISYGIFGLRKTEMEFAAFPSKEIARSTRCSNWSCDSSCLLPRWRPAMVMTLGKRFARYAANSVANRITGP